MISVLVVLKSGSCVSMIMCLPSAKVIVLQPAKTSGISSATKAETEARSCSEYFWPSAAGLTPDAPSSRLAADGVGGYY
jgi:hypothetical protein